jgi:long-chain acyl-CoA synthetase
MKEAGFKVFTMEELISFGAKNPVTPSKEVNGDTVWTLCYTSGTTGDPKGVMITQQMFIACVANISYCGIDIKPGKEACLSYLPLAHVAERMIYFSVFYYGGRIGIFPSSNKKDLPKALKHVQPTIFLSVPRLYNKFYAAFTGKISNLRGCLACLVNRALRVKGENVYKNDYKHFFYDKILKKMRVVLGGKVRVMITGAAPINGEVK